jgi:hypothetical protein
MFGMGESTGVKGVSYIWRYGSGLGPGQLNYCFGTLLYVLWRFDKWNVSFI